jgi:hypothetical protein
MGIYIEIALSLILVLLVLSLVVTAINELIAMQLRKRPKMLFRTIAAIIDDPALRKSFYANGIVVSASEASAGAPGTPGAAGAANPPAAAEVSDVDHPSYIEGQNFARALTMAVLRNAGNKGPMADVFGIPEVKAAVLALPPELRIRDVLIGALASANTSVEDFEKKVAAWFDTTQDRLTGEYARHQRWITIFVGAILVVVLNADAVRLTRELQSNDAVRTAMVAKANHMFDKGIVSDCADRPGDELEACIVAETRDYLDLLDPAIVGWKSDPAGLIVANAYASAASHLAPTATAAEEGAAAGVGATPGNPVSILFNKLVGLVITVMAISLGAPFWFDMLNKVVNIRGAGIKPEKTAAQP